MSKPFLTVVGLYAYDNTIFNGLTVPDGMSTDDVREKILVDNAELPLIYADADVFRLQLRVWCKTHALSWARMYDALATEYSPLENYDRHEEFTDTGSDTGSTEAENLRQVGGWNNAEGWSDSEKNTGSSSDSRSTSNRRVGRMHGNIGVTTSQQMLESEIDLRVKYNMLQIISDSFRENFCIQIY